MIAALRPLLARPAAADNDVAAQSRFFITSDGVRLHYLEAGPHTGHTIVFVPGLDHAGLDLAAADPGLRASLPRRGVRSARPG